MDLYNVNKEFQLPATHPHIANFSRSTTIDYCLYSPRVLENIVYMGSTPYDLEVLGDHCGIIVDINIEGLLGMTQQEDELQQRKLVTNHPGAVKKYLVTVEEKLTKQNIYQRCQKLLNRVLAGHTDYASIMRQYEALDGEIFGICKKAEQYCQPALVGKHDWSPALVVAIKQIRYWRYCLRVEEETIITKRMGEELNIKYEKLSKSVLQMMVNLSRDKLTEI